MGLRSIALLFAATLACTRTIDGPRPTVSSTRNVVDPTHTPAVVCNAQGDPMLGWTIDILGAGFTPMPRGILTDTMSVAMPTCSLSGPETYDVPRDQLFFVDATQLTARLPTRNSMLPHELKPGVYALSVTNPSHQQGQLAAAVKIVAPPTIEKVRLLDSSARELDPVLCLDVDQRLVIRGANFRMDAKPAIMVGSKVLPDADVTVEAPDRITAVVRADTFAASEASEMGRSYSIKVASPEGCVAPFGSAPKGFGITDVLVVTKPALAGVKIDAGMAFMDPLICEDAGEVTLVISGTSLWSIGDGTSGLVPEVLLVNADGALAADRVTLTPAPSMPAPSYSGSTLTAHFRFLPTLEPGPSTLRVTNANRGTVEVTDAVVVEERPTITRVTSPIDNTTDATITIDGSGFVRDLTSGTVPVVRISTSSQAGLPLSNVLVESSTRLSAVVPMGTPQGTYEVSVTNPDGCSARAIPEALVIHGLALGTLTLNPRFGWQLKNQTVTIHNSVVAPQLPFSGGAPEVHIVAPLKTDPTTMVDIPMRRAAFVDPSTITAVVPDCSGLMPMPATGPACLNGIVPGGPYAITVRDPSGATATIPAARGFVVRADPPPVITSLSPPVIDTRGLPSNLGSDLVIRGMGFGVMASPRILSQPPGTRQLRACELSVIGRSAAEIRAAVPPMIPQASCVDYDAAGTALPAAGGLVLDAGLFVIRVQNSGADPAFADYSGLIVTKVGLSPINGPPISTKLATPRADFPLVEATDDQGGHYMYALGGSNGLVTLSTVEVAEVTPFGDLSGVCAGASCTFRVLERTPLGLGNGSAVEQPRRGVTAVVRTDPNDTSYIYALGGIDDTGRAVAAVERAQVLRVADAPLLSPPTLSSGSLARGTYYYRVSAILSDNDGKNPRGETLASEEESVVVPQAGGAVGLSWICVPEAPRYRIYRSLTPSGVSGSEQLLEEIAADATCTEAPSYTDLGTRTPAGDRPLPRGALGRWVMQSPLAAARGNAAAKILGDELYVVGGASAAGAELASVEHATFMSAELGAFSDGGTLGHARQRHSLAIADFTTAPTSFQGAMHDARLLVVGGDAGGAIISSGIIEVAKARSDGVYAAVLGFADASYATFGEHGGWVEVVANVLFQAGATGDSGFSFRSNLVCPGMGTIGACSSTISFQGTLNQTGISYQIGGPRYLAGQLLFRAYFYFAGGFASDQPGALPTDTLERINY